MHYKPLLFKLNSTKLFRISQIKYRNTSTLYYEIPERYRDTIYLSNASLFDSSNWFVHKAYQKIFPEIVNDLSESANIQQDDAVEQIFNIINIIDQCSSLIDIRFPVKRNDGTLELIRGFRSTFNEVSGFYPYIGGIRMHEQLTRDQIKGISVLVGHRLSSLGLKVAGGFGGIKINPCNYAQNELENIMSMYLSNCSKVKFYDAENFLLESDINTNKDILFKNEFGRNFINYVDWDEEDEAAAKGAYFIMEYFLNHDFVADKLKFDKGFDGKTFVVQGLGKMGSLLSKYLQSAGAVCVGFKEHNCYLNKEQGLDINDVVEHKEKHGDLLNYPMIKCQDNFDIFHKKCDMLILAAVQKSVVCSMAKNIKAPLIVEAAYGAITPSAWQILQGAGKIILPDILTCGGSAVATLLGYWSIKDEGYCGRFLPKFYQNLIDVLSNSKENSSLVVSGKSVNKLNQNCIKKDVLSFGLEHAFTTKSQELIDKCLKYHLGFDFKTAAYIMSIKNIFKNIMSQKTFNA